MELGGLALGKIKAKKPHAHAAQLEHHICTPGQYFVLRQPLETHFTGAARIRPYAQHTAHVVQHDGVAWKSAGQIGQLRQLRLVNPGIKGRSRPTRQSLSERPGRPSHKAAGGPKSLGQPGPGATPRCSECRENAPPCVHMRLQHRPHLSPRQRSAWPMMAAATRQGSCSPLALSDAAR